MNATSPGLSRVALVVAVVVASATCKCRQPPVDEAKTGSDGTTEAVETGEADWGPETGRTIYEDLVRAAESYHVSSDQTRENLGFGWEDGLPRLEEEFSQVDGRGDVLRAIDHFAGNLHNPHCYYRSPDRPDYQTPGFEIRVEWIGDEPRFYVADVHDPDLEERIQPGDTLVSYESVEATDFLTAFHMESTGNHWRAIARDIATFFWRRSPHDGGDLEDAEWGFRSEGSGELVTVRAAWKRPEDESRGGEFRIDYDEEGCAGLPDRNYGEGYAIARVGANYCIYTTGTGPERAFPIVRQFSFSYSKANGFSALESDHRNLKEFLGGLEDAQGVILDLRDNRGGNNPNWFLDWWAPASYTGSVVYTRLHDDLDTMDELAEARITGWGPPHFEIYLEALASKEPGDEFMDGVPFFCPTPDCRGFDNVYHPSNHVTTLPVALIVGPRCASSCDDLVRTFRENDFGPVVGMAGSAGLTARRLRHQVRHPQTGEDLGWVDLAFSYETSGTTGERLEGVVLEPHHVVEPTFQNLGDYDAILVDTAIDAFATFDFPGPATTD